MTARRAVALFLAAALVALGAWWWRPGPEPPRVPTPVAAPAAKGSKVETTKERLVIAPPEVVEAADPAAAAPAPPGPIAAAGLVARWAGERWEIEEVVPGSHAWDVGVRPGDRLLEVEGVLASTVPGAELQEILDGPDASDVEILIERDNVDPGAPPVKARLVLSRAVAPG